MSLDFTLQRTPFGRLLLIDADGTRHEGVVPVRAFPITSPQSGLSLVSSDGHELFWLDTLDNLPPDQRALIQEELAQREFIPVIQRLTHVSSFSTPSDWDIETDRGTVRITLRSEDDIRRLSDHTLLISSSNGVQYLIQNQATLDRHSHKLLSRFL